MTVRMRGEDARVEVGGRARRVYDARCFRPAMPRVRLAPPAAWLVHRGCAVSSQASVMRVMPKHVRRRKPSNKKSKNGNKTGATMSGGRGGLGRFTCLLFVPCEIMFFFTRVVVPASRRTATYKYLYIFYLSLLVGGCMVAFYFAVLGGYIELV